MEALQQILAVHHALLRAVQPNLALAWLWIVLGFVFGAVLGLSFQREEWLGGYGSLKRRLYRLSHISFFGLAIINLLFVLTVLAIGKAGDDFTLAAWGFRVGAVSMPVCCLLMAHFPKTQALFAIPVGSLIGAGLLTLWKVLSL